MEFFRSKLQKLGTFLGVELKKQRQQQKNNIWNSLGGED